MLIKNDMLEEKNIKGPAVAAAVFLSTSYLSQMGTRTIPLPIPSAPPIIPAIKPLNISFLILLAVIFLLTFSKTKPRFSFSVSSWYFLMARDLV